MALDYAAAWGKTLLAREYSMLLLACSHEPHRTPLLQRSRKKALDRRRQAALQSRKPALEKRLVMALPDTPNSPLQAYRSMEETQ